MRRVCVVALVVASFLVPVAAAAQELPPPPAEVPPVPEPVSGALAQVLDTAGPPANDAATQLAPVATATGFAFRPMCSTLGTAMVALVLAGAYLPSGVNVGHAVGPLLIYCTHTYKLGPADPLFAQIDAMLAPFYDDQVQPITDRVYEEGEPVRGQLATGCGYSPLLAAPLTSLPPPLNRVDLVRFVCG